MLTSKVVLMASKTLAVLEEKGYTVDLGMVAGSIYEIKLYANGEAIDMVLTANDGLKANNKEALERARRADPLIENIQN